LLEKYNPIEFYFLCSSSCHLHDTGAETYM
jgi:hypothetical protein